MPHLGTRAVKSASMVYGRHLQVARNSTQDCKNKKETNEEKKKVRLREEHVAFTNVAMHNVRAI